MIKSLKSIGEQGTLKVSDFTLSTDPANDFKEDGVEGDPSKAGSGALFIIGGKNKEIFINTNSGDYKNAAGGTGDKRLTANYILYLASGAAHERFHLSGSPNALSERAAYAEQERVMVAFKRANYVTSTNFYNSIVIPHIRRGMAGEFGP